MEHPRVGHGESEVAPRADGGVDRGGGTAGGLLRGHEVVHGPIIPGPRVGGSTADALNRAPGPGPRFAERGPARARRTSSYSGKSGECVEVAEGVVTAVRDTRHRELGHLTVPAAEWSALVSAVRTS
ncbi:DUF397 domain-containing protein [Nocardiopsis tropica]|uniref:DUF397 domain-containing protein n=1 Tax=Nocardiopsis tropica TaxID=109330 RepID=UPI003379E650